MGLQRWSPSPVRAANTTFSEDFTTTTYKDTTSSTAAWYGKGIVEVAATNTFTFGRWQAPNSGTADIAKISCISDTTCWIAAENSAILKTTDGGATWVVQHDQGTNFGLFIAGVGNGELTGIKAVNANTIYAVGAITNSTPATTTKSYALKSTDGGDSWKQILKLTTTSYFYDVDCVDANNCFVAGRTTSGAKTVRSTSDGGQTWTTESLPAGSYNLYAVQAFNDGASTTVRAVGSGGKIIKGRGTAPPYTWAAETVTSTSPSFISIECTDFYNCYAVGGANAYWQTVNAGANWAQRSAGYPTSLPNMREVDCSPNTTSTCWIIADEYGIRKTTDGGNSWSDVTPSGGDMPYFLSGAHLAALSDSVAYAVGGMGGTSGYGLMTKTTDGTNWSSIVAGLDGGAILGIDMIDASTGWAVSQGGNVFKTTNGTSWPSIASDSTQIQGVDFVDANTGWFVGTDGVDGVVKKTTNGGTSWTAQACDDCILTNLEEVQMWNASVGYLVGGSGMVRKTTDGGASGWSAVTSTINSYDYSWYALYVVNTSTVYIGGYDSVGGSERLYKTTDGGSSWTRQNDSGYDGAIGSIYCLDGAGEKCWAYNSDYDQVYKTTTGGGSGSWQVIGLTSSPGVVGQGRIMFLSESVGFLAVDNYLFYTANGGSNWNSAIYSNQEWEGGVVYRNNIWLVGGTSAVSGSSTSTIDKVVSYYASSSLAQSTTIDSTSADISCANATVASSTPTGTSATFQMSNDGGITWTSAGGATCAGGTGMNYNFVSTGSDLRWRSTLTSGSPVSAAITGVSVTYSHGSAAAAPNTPSNLSPSAGATNVLLTPTLTSSAFSDPDPGDTHASSYWMITGPAGTVVDTGASSTSKTSYAAASGLLVANTVYSWKVKHCDQTGSCSSFSAPTSFTTAGAAAVSPSKTGPPTAPVAGRGSGLSPSEVRWRFKDTSANEQGFEIRDGEGNMVFSTQPIFSENLAFGDEKGLLPNVAYCGRTVLAFNNNGYSAASAPFPCAATLANQPKAAAGATVSATEVSLIMDPDDGNPAATEYAFYETTTRQWVSQADGFASGSPKYALSAAPLWQTYEDWGGVSGFVIGSLTPGTTYSFETRVRNLDGDQTPPESDKVTVTVTTKSSAAKLTVALGVKVNQPVSLTADTSVSSATPLGINRTLSLALLLSALSLLVSSGSLFTHAERRKSGLQLRTLLNLHRHPLHSYALLHGDTSEKSFSAHSTFHRASGFSALAVITVLVAKLAALAVLGLPTPSSAEVTGFTDDGATVSSGGTLTYRAVVTAEGTDPSTAVALRLPVPVGTQYEKGTIKLDGVQQNDSGSFDSSGAVRISLGNMSPGAARSVDATVRTQPSAVLVSNSATVFSNQFPGGIKSNTVSNPVKAAVVKPPPPPPEEEEETAPEEEKKRAPPPPSGAPAITEPVSGTVTNNTTPTVSGRTSPNVTVTIFVNGEPAGAARSDPDGFFSLILSDPLPDGQNSVEAESNGKLSTLIVFLVDTVPPGAPEIAVSIVRELPTDKPGFWATTLSVRGVTPPDTKAVRFVISPDPFEYVFEPEDPEWQTYVSATIQEGEHEMVVTALDEAGNKSSATLVSFALGPPACNDGEDNDRDGATDFPDDAGCLGIGDPSEEEEIVPLGVARQCSDSSDNDSDGLLDFPDDPGCSSMLDNDETDETTQVLQVLPQCRDGQDNDKDGQIDYPSDLGCENGNDPDETDAFEFNASQIAIAATRVARFVNNHVLDNPAVEKVNETYAAPTVAAAIAVNAVSSVGAPALLSWLQLLGTQPLLLLSRRKKKGYGLAYNTLSKLPVDLATIRLLDAQTNRVLQSSVTDRLGRYFFLAPVGSFTLEARKQGFTFPSSLLSGRSEDASYLDLSYGEPITLPKGGAITKAIPLDPQVPELPRGKVLRSNRLRELQGILAGSGPMLAAVSLAISPNKIILAILVLHLVLYGLFRRLAVAKAPKSWGLIRDAQSGKPIPSAVVRVFSVEYNKLLETKVSDARGRYAFLVGSSRYYLTAEKPGYAKRQTSTLDFSGEKMATTVNETLTLEKEGTAPPVLPPAPPPPAPLAPIQPQDSTLPGISEMRIRRPRTAAKKVKVKKPGRRSHRS